MSAKIHLTKVYMWVRLIHFETESAITTWKSSIRGNNSEITVKFYVKSSHNNWLKYPYLLIIFLTSYISGGFDGKDEEDFLT